MELPSLPCVSDSSVVSPLLLPHCQLRHSTQLLGERKTVKCPTCPKHQEEHLTHHVNPFNIEFPLFAQPGASLSFRRLPFGPFPLLKILKVLKDGSQYIPLLLFQLLSVFLKLFSVFVLRQSFVMCPWLFWNSLSGPCWPQLTAVVFPPPPSYRVLRL